MTKLHWYYLLVGFMWVPALLSIGVITLAGLWAWRGLIAAFDRMGNLRG